MKPETAAERQAYQALDEQEYEEARRLADQILVRDRRSARAHHVRGLALVELADIPNGLKSLEKACKFATVPWEAHLDLIEVLLQDAQDSEAAIRVCQHALAAKPERSIHAALLHLLGQAWLDQGEPGQALAAYEQARRLGPEHDDMAGRGAALFELCRFPEAIAALRTGLRHQRGLDAAGYFTLGMALERIGDEPAALRQFQAAARAEPDAFPVPRRCSAEEFEQIVAQALDELPEEISRPLQNVPVRLEPWPEVEELTASDPPLSPLIFGMFRGHSLREQSGHDPWSLLPPQILLYQRNLELQCRSREEMIEEIRITVWHEVGHYLGLDEEDLRERGLD